VRFAFLDCLDLEPGSILALHGVVFAILSSGPRGVPRLRGGLVVLSRDGGTGSPGKRLKNNKLHLDLQATQALSRAGKKPKWNFWRAWALSA
jgi:hypothetical protein